jgi:adenosylcobyric acid synthase
MGHVMSSALMIQGTGSGVGKSIIVAGLCRIFRDMGIHVAPFKAQNMALNSFITKDGSEIGRAQALQAEAARIDPSVDMNPVLLKASGEAGCQVIMNGRVHSKMTAQEYYSFTKGAWMTVTEAYERLTKRFDLIVIEGAGSPAEINLRDSEIVNMRVARYADAPVVLVGDIDKGGVFASFYGTIGLLNGEADYIKAFIINKFRGDATILKPGLSLIHERTGRPVIGVIPYLGDLRLHEEDGIPTERLGSSTGPGYAGSKIKIVVVRLRYIANFTDFDPFIFEPDAELMYSLRDNEIKNADLIIIPGSKNTVQDLLFLRENGIEGSIRGAVKKGVPLIGICGGYQMLGQKILDPFGIESSYKEVKAFGLLDIETTIEKTKITSQVEADMLSEKIPGVTSLKSLKGYEIHMGISSGDTGLFSLRRLSENCEPIIDGAVKGNIWGTYIHGIFDNDRFRRDLINSIRTGKGLKAVEETLDYSWLRDNALSRWAEILKKNIDIEFIQGLITGQKGGGRKSNIWS